MNEIPADPMILIGYVNMKLRDFYPSLDAMCENLNIDRESIEKPLNEIGFEYNPQTNKFW